MIRNFNGQFWIIVHDHDPSTVMRREPIICICVPPPPQEHGSSVSACLCYYETMIYLLPQLCTTSKHDSSTFRFLRSARSYYYMIHTIQLRAFFTTARPWFISCVHLLQLRLHRLPSSAATFICCSYVHLKLRSRPFEVTPICSTSYVPVRLKLRGPSAVATFPSIWSCVQLQ